MADENKREDMVKPNKLATAPNKGDNYDACISTAPSCRARAGVSQGIQKPIALHIHIYTYSGGFELCDTTLLYTQFKQFPSVQTPTGCIFLCASSKPTLPAGGASIMCLNAKPNRSLEKLPTLRSQRRTAWQPLASLAAGPGG